MGVNDNNYKNRFFRSTSKNGGKEKKGEVVGWVKGKEEERERERENADAR